ncbi:MAG: hypothetical protein LBU98_00965, partial [Alistipes sp.]|nr:hypothetical protein [Alistipes sp.]
MVSFKDHKVTAVDLLGVIPEALMSQRTLEDTFNDSIFKTLFGLDEDERIRHSSLSERLGRIT